MSKIHPDPDNPASNSKIKKFIAEQFEQKVVLLCQFCGGESCPQEDYRTNKIQPNSVEGLHSNWITDQILAMQRPSDRIIKQYNIFEKFKKLNINTILNLQEPGQHPFCGDGLLSKVGFSYNPEEFFANGILFFNQSWEDMTATTFQHMMRIMNIFNISIIQNKGRISVHCHAGRGRTLLVICSWLIYHSRFTAKYTIDLAVERRQGVLTRSSQRQFLHYFQAQLQKRWKTFSPTASKSFSEFTRKQNVSLLKAQQKIAGQKPYIHSSILNELRKRSQKAQNGKEIIEAMLGNFHVQIQAKQVQLLQTKDKINTHQLFNKDTNLVEVLGTNILVQLLYDFYDELPFTLIGPYALELLLSEGMKKQSNKINALLTPEIVHEIEIEGLTVLLDLVHFLKQLVNSSLKIADEKGQDYQKCQCLFIRIAILTCSKTKYHPKIFPAKYRCKLLNYPPEKRQKYTNVSIIDFANFLRSLTGEIPKQLSDMDVIIKKIRKIDANLHYYIQNNKNEKGFFKEEDARKIYEDSKI